jgi:hypothetical protein
VEKYDRPSQVTDDGKIWLMHVACWVTMDRETDSEYTIIVVFSLQQSFANTLQ